MTNQKCDCIFCNFKCPDCGAEEIKVKYSPVFTCYNDMENKIVVDRDMDRFELNCQECDTSIEHDEYDFEFDNQKIEPLRNALSEYLRIPKTTHFEYEDHGKIKQFQIEIISRTLDEKEVKALLEKKSQRKEKPNPQLT